MRAPLPSPAGAILGGQSSTEEADHPGWLLQPEEGTAYTAHSSTLRTRVFTLSSFANGCQLLIAHPPSWPPPLLPGHINGALHRGITRQWGGTCTTAWGGGEARASPRRPCSPNLGCVASSALCLLLPSRCRSREPIGSLQPPLGQGCEHEGGSLAHQRWAGFNHRPTGLLIPAHPQVGLRLP